MITMQTLRWHGERKATITQRLRFASHASPDATLGLVYAHEAGLEPEEIDRARRTYGDNSVPASGMDVSPARRLAEAFLDPFVGVLALLAAVSFGCSMARRNNGLFAAEGGDGMPVTVGLIVLMVAVSVVIRYMHSARSSHAIRALSHLVDTTTLVRRVGDGERRVPADELVVGDIVLLAPGDTVPADCKLLDSRDLRVAQGLLTGESMPVAKDAGSLLATDDRTTALTDAPSLVFMGTAVISGSALALVIATGRHTLFGGLSRSLSRRRSRTRFEHGMNSTSWMLMAFTAVTVPVAMLVAGLAGSGWVQALLSGVSVAVGLTPEALPLIVTVCLAKGAQAMAAGRVIVKRLDAVETLGRMDTLCVDKTGTLTDGVIGFDHARDMDGRRDDDVLLYAWLTTMIPGTAGNPWDDAIAAAHAAGGDGNTADGGTTDGRGPVVAGGMPFDSVRRRAVAIVMSNDAAAADHPVMAVKGAVSAVLPRCSAVLRDGLPEPLTERLRDAYERRMDGLASQGYRVLLVARRDMADAGLTDDNDLTLLGYLMFMDSPKSDAKSTIARLHDAGIAVTMLTGDEPQVARTVARQVGINAGRVIVGQQLDDMRDAELSVELDHTSVFAKLSPMHKARIVSLLRREGHCVGHMGDGINDMPAMQAGEIAISADTGSDAVREAADVLLTRKDLGVLLKGVTASRRTHVNIMKYLKLALSSNLGNIISVIIAGAFLPFVPMAPVQMVLLNILYDLTCLTIPFDRVDEEALRRPTRWDTPSIARFMACFGPISSVFDMVTFAAMSAIVCPAVAGGPFPGLHGSGAQALFIATFQSGWFIVSMWTQITALSLLRTEHAPFVRGHAAAPLTCASLAALLLVTALPFTPAGASAGFRALPGAFLPLLAAVVVGYATLVLVVKHLYLRRIRPLL